MHIGKHSRNVGNQRHTVAAIDFDQRDKIAFQNVRPRHRYKPVCGILCRLQRTDIDAVCTMDRDAVAARYKPDDLIAWHRRAAMGKLHQAGIDAFYDDPAL